MKNYYKLLQIDPSAEPAIIKSAYRTIMLNLKNHPDCGGDTACAQEINEAYSILKDPVKRKEYDKKNFYIMQNESCPKESRRFYYMRCYFCSTINRIDFNSTKTHLKTIKCGKCHSPFFSDTADIHKLRTHKRKYERFKCNFDISIQLKFKGEIYKGTCIDISSNGLRFYTETELKVDQIIKIQFKHNGFHAIAKIIRVKNLIDDHKQITECAATYIEARYDNKPLKN